ncbi:MAG: UDP-N-acetylmuramoyl-tripeptide--D-alanyl-D-alanine ligase [Pseudomonadota bacterium]
MVALSLQSCAKKMDATLHGGDVVFDSVSTDTRTLRKGQLFVALVGEKFDAHEKIDASVCDRALGFVVNRELDVDVPQLIVSDTLRALGDLARQWRERINAPIVAITGSNGKTTVKEMTAAILRQRGNVFSTVGNLNNEVGMPLSMMSTSESHEYIVLELGANHAREIEYLTEIARPHAAIVNNAGPSHLEGFGSLDGVARAKGEIYSGLGDDGIAIVNIDDDYADYWLGLTADLTCITFGMSQQADVRGELDENQRLRIDYKGHSSTVTLPVPGRHNAMNALAASAVSFAVGATLKDAVAGLKSMRGVSGRLQFKPGQNGARIIDDSYNANPGSLAAAIDVLAGLPEGRKICALGEMRELGENAAGIHREMGALAFEKGIDSLFVTGEFARHYATGFGKGASEFSDHESLASALINELDDQTYVLVKGSRGARMERVVELLVDPINHNNKGEQQC